jgi:2-iminobutanoate/2-iminopropanoate deaminase
VSDLEYPTPAGVAAPISAYSPVVVSGDHVFVAGQVAFDQDRRLVEGGIGAQTGQTIENLRLTLAAAGCDLTDVVKVNAYLADRGDVPEYNRAYRDGFPVPYPARTTIVCGLSEGILVEIEAIARRRR